MAALSKNYIVYYRFLKLRILKYPFSLVRLANKILNRWQNSLEIFFTFFLNSLKTETHFQIFNLPNKLICFKFFK